jgi:transcription elongation factor Elf1
MPCPKCNRKRYTEKIVKKNKRNFLIRECLSCETRYSLMEVRKSKLTNEWIEKDDEKQI